VFKKLSDFSHFFTKQNSIYIHIYDWEKISFLLINQLT